MIFQCFYNSYLTVYGQHPLVGIKYQSFNGSLLQATLPECCPYPVNSSEEVETPREELVGTFLDFALLLTYIGSLGTSCHVCKKQEYLTFPVHLSNKY